MVNVGLNPSSLVGLALVVAGAALYFLRNFRPGLARDHDIFFAAVSLLCGGILFFQGWRQDPILQFGQFLMAASAIFFAYESIRLRGIATEQAKRTTPIVDDDRPISRVYRAELDDYAAIEERPVTRRRIQGTRDRSAQVDEYGDEVRRPASGRSSNERIGSGAGGDRPPRKRRSNASGRSESGRSESGRSPQRSEDRFSDGDSRPFSERSDRDVRRSVWDDDVEQAPTRRGDAASPRAPRNDAAPSRPKRPRPSQGESASRRPDVQKPDSPPSSDYVDYQPINYSGDEPDNSSNFD
jgi:Ycf66 protein N-terminus